MPNFVDHFGKVTGTLIIIAYARDGSVLWRRDEGENLVVTTGRQMMSRLLGGNPSATIQTNGGRTVNISGVGDLFVTTMVFGSGGHNPTSGTPLVVSPSEETISVPLTSLPSGKPVSVNYPGTPPGDKSIEFIANVDFSEANGETFSEEGLFNALFGTSNELMFAKKNFAPITKNNSFRLEFRHRIIF